jgi:hypothetical protein
METHNNWTSWHLDEEKYYHIDERLFPRIKKKEKKRIYWNILCLNMESSSLIIFFYNLLNPIVVYNLQKKPITILLL